ncbi:hypothetical protein Tco_0822469 [Tanacetum coccineum]|uniref:Uncharacterized protein n=1 Tax=Tanacetum coccineum TaxID=301880 RepID=A0ABQ5AF49_9ASTR
MATSNIPISAEENLGDPIDIQVDVIHPEPVAAVAFPQSHYGTQQKTIVVATLLRAENASLRTRFKTTEAIEKNTRKREDISC